MTTSLNRPPVTGLGELSNESRVLATPWSRMVRGIGLGQYPVAYDPEVAAAIRATFGRLAGRVPAGNSYTLFSRLLAELVLKVTDPEREYGRASVARDLGPVVDAFRAEPNPYHRLSLGCILLDAFAKLELDRGLLVNGELDVPAEVLATVDAIRPDQIKDENAGGHGDYERLSGYSAVFLAFGQLGLGERLVTAERDHIGEALGLLERIPSPFFRGRGGSVLLSAISLLGHGDRIFDGERDFMKEVLDHLDRGEELGPASFPQPMTPAFSQVYPLVTMLNAIAVAGRPEYLTYRRDRLAEMRGLWERIAPAERTHMGLYYLVALLNLGRLEDQLPDLEGFVTELVGQWEGIDPGANFFLNGIAYAYLIETAMVTGRTELVTDGLLERVVDSYPDLDVTDLDRVNRPYPFSYVLNMLGEIGEWRRLFAPRARYGGLSATEWVVDHLSPDGVEEGARLYLLDHALVSWALRMRGTGRGETEYFSRLHPIAAPAPVR
ncbi:hypothetical protein ACIRBX_14870 [Kitasatospora sp. NPDC096147]|uniref:hypothetical protein n=1 Tax=Kitasatospora sp. NPDC096147 TaxID=3364093 RepID=UPI0037FAB9E1